MQNSMTKDYGQEFHVNEHRLHDWWSSGGHGHSSASETPQREVGGGGVDV